MPLFEAIKPGFDSLLKQIKKIEPDNKKIIILCNEIDGNNKIFFENLKNYSISIFTKDAVYSEFLKPSGLYPKIIFEPNKKKKLKLKEIMLISFNKTNTKKYFFSGLIIFVCSFFVRFNFYYVFMSSLLFLFSLICKNSKTTVTR